MEIQQAVEQEISEYDVCELIAGGYAKVDHLALRCVADAKQRSLIKTARQSLLSGNYVCLILAQCVDPAEHLWQVIIAAVGQTPGQAEIHFAAIHP